MEINNLKKYHKNPRKITEKKFKELGKTLEEFGDLSGVVVNTRTNEVIGGNQRTAFFQENSKDVKIVKTSSDAGFIEFKGHQFSYREVDWDEEKEARANIIANKSGGFWDNDILANQFDENMLLSSGFEDFELGMFNPLAVDGSGRDSDQSSLDSTLDTYLDGSIKQVVLYFKKEDYDEFIERLEHVKDMIGAADFTQVVEELLSAYENTQGN